MIERPCLRQRFSSSGALVDIVSIFALYDRDERRTNGTRDSVHRTGQQAHFSEKWPRRLPAEAAAYI